jgi:hypothetical protein
MRKIKTNEEKTAEKIIDAMNDYTLWEELVGFYLFELAPSEVFDKIVVASERAIEERDKEIDRQQQPQRKLTNDNNPPF